MKLFLFLLSVLMAVHLGLTKPFGLCPLFGGAKLLPDTNDCSIFYQCSWGKYIAKRCPATLVFNSLTAECDYPKNVNCGHTSNSTNTESGNENNETTESVEVGVAIGTCPEENHGEDILLPDSINCAAYYKCFWGEPILELCPEGLVFSIENNVCDWPRNVDCDRSNIGGNNGTNNGAGDENGGEPIVVGGVIGTCPEDHYNEEILLPDFINCAVYYKCFWGNPILAICPEGLVFNLENNVCDWPRNVDCDRSNSGGSSGNNKGGNETEHVAIQIGGVIGDCPRVTSNEEILLPDSMNCAAFYKCSWGEPILELCPDGLVFSIANRGCDWPENVDCNRSNVGQYNRNNAGNNGSSNGNEGGATDSAGPVGSCPVRDGERVILLPDAANCVIFYQCSRGLPVVQVCPDNLVFNTETDECDWPENVNCDRNYHEDSNGGSSNDDGHNESNQTNSTPLFVYII